MKNLLLLSIIAFLLNACEEVPPTIDFSEPTVLLKDSTYIATTIPIAQHKAVLLEDVTGVRCNNCPTAAAKAKDIISQKTSDSVVVLALYGILPSLPQTTKYPNVPQLSNNIATQIIERLDIPVGIPSGYVDRKKFTGSNRGISINEWINYVNIRLRLKTPVNINLKKNITDRKVVVEMKLQYTENVPSNNHKYALYLMEDSIVSKQEMPDLSENENYVHNHALKYSFGVPIGVPLDASLVAGRTFIKQFEYDIPSDIRINHSHIICVVLDSSTEEVINVREIDL